MNKEEYLAKKEVLLKQKNEIQREIDDLVEAFHTEELADYQQMYNGKYILSYERELRLNGSGRKLPNHFHIYYVEKVSFIGYGFFRFKGIDWEVEYSESSGYVECKVGFIEDKDLDAYLKRIDEILSKEKAMKLLFDAKILCCKICDSLKIEET